MGVLARREHLYPPLDECTAPEWLLRACRHRSGVRPFLFIKKKYRDLIFLRPIPKTKYEQTLAVGQWLSWEEEISRICRWSHEAFIENYEPVHDELT